MYENYLDGFLPVDTLGQILAIIFIVGLVVCMVVGVVGCLKHLKRFLDSVDARYAERCKREQERNEREDENWRQIPSALQLRIKQLEKTCKENQNTIAQQKLELLKKDEFMDRVHVIDLYQIWKETNI